MIDEKACVEEEGTWVLFDDGKYLWQWGGGGLFRLNEWTNIITQRSSFIYSIIINMIVSVKEFCCGESANARKCYCCDWVVQI